MGAKRVVTGRDRHFAPLECLLAKALYHLPVAKQICPRAFGETKAQKILFILSHRYDNDFASIQTRASSSDVVLTYPLASPFKTDSGYFVPVMNPDISLLHLTI